MNNSSNHSIYAIWTAKTYTVTFDSTGGSSVSSKTVTYGSTYGSLPTPTKSGSTFIGWYTSGGVKVTSTTTVTSTSNHTLYAQWQNVYNLIGSDEAVLMTLDISSTGTIPFLYSGYTGISSADVYIDGVRQSSFVKSYNFTTTGKHTVLLKPASINRFNNMFKNCNYITSVRFFNLKENNAITSLESMFEGCSKLQYVDLSELDKVTESLTSLKNMFKSCSSIESVDLSRMNMSNVVDVERMFEDCYKLSNVKFGNQKTSELWSMTNIISGCNSLCHFDFSNFTIGGSTDAYGFSDCDNKDWVFSEDVDFVVLMNLGCGNPGGGGNNTYHPSGRYGYCENPYSCDGYIYENTCVSTCPAYTTLGADRKTCERTSDWYKQFEP